MVSTSTKVVASSPAVPVSETVIASPALPKTEVGGVVLTVTGEDSVGPASSTYGDGRRRRGRAVPGKVEGGPEMLIGVTVDHGSGSWWCSGYAVYVECSRKLHTASRIPRRPAHRRDAAEDG